MTSRLRQPFPPEPPTRPDHKRVKNEARRSVLEAAPKGESTRASTTPPPGRSRQASAARDRDKEPSKRPTQPERKGKSVSNIRTTSPALSGATVDEVTADMSQDPRRDRE